MVKRTYRLFVIYSGLIAMGIVTSGIRYVTFGKGIAFNRAVVAPLMSRTILALVGVKLRNRMDHAAANGSVCYFFNHNSLMDIFLIPMLGLKNTRFIITEGVKKIIPLHLCNLGIDVLYIPDTEKTEQRIEFFKRVTEDLKAGRYSVICSPEGRHEFRHWIAPFNRGVFHMATASKRPIHTLFFDIPRDCNPLKTADMKSCEVEIRTMELVATEAWSLGDLTTNITSVRKLFLDAYYDTYGDYGESAS